MERDKTGRFAGDGRVRYNAQERHYGKYLSGSCKNGELNDIHV